MKKAISMILALVLVLSMSTTAFAAESGDIKVTYSQPPAQVVTIVDITWGSLEFNYSSGDTKVWNPDTLQYDIIPGEGDGTWTPKNENGDTVTVTNHSNTGLEVTVTYTPAEENGVAGSVTNGIFTLATAEGTDVNNAPRDSAKLTLDNTSAPAQWATDGATTIGNMTVTLRTIFSMDATNSTAYDLEKNLLASLNVGTTDISITLAADADDEMFIAINTALRSSTAAEGSVNLTIAGAQTISNITVFTPDGAEAPLALKTLTLPDATKLDQEAIMYASYLEAIYLPNVTSISAWGLDELDALNTLVLSAEGTIAFSNFSTISLPFANIDLTLNKDKESEVTNGNEWMGKTWKSITFVD